MKVVFNPSSEFVSFVNTTEIQKYFTTTAVRILMVYPSNDIDPLASYYAIAGLNLVWQCQCYGHASQCTGVVGMAV